MQSQFAQLVEMEIFHHYHIGGTGDDFQIRPTRLSTSQLRNYGLLFQKTARGFAILSETTLEDGNLQPLKPIEEDVKFSFILEARSPYLLNYSDLPLDSSLDQIYYLNNIHRNKQGDSLLLTADATRDHLSLKDRIFLKPQVFQYRIESANPSVKVEIVDETGKSMINQTLASNSGVLEYPVNLSEYPPGKFILKVNTSKQLEFYADDELSGKNVFGIINLFHHSKVPAAYRFLDAQGAIVPKTYRVNIANRQTYWKYYIVLKYRPDIAPQDLSITCPAVPGGISFQQKTVHPVADGTPAIPFISETALGLQEEPIKGIQLTRKHGDGTQDIEVQNLPNASVTSLTPDPADNKVYSEIFVYI